MPVAIIVLGILLIIVGVRNKHQQLGAQLASDFTGAGNFFYWVAAIVIVGGLGYIESLKTPSRMFLGLIILAMLISNRGVFQAFVDQLRSGTAQPSPPGPPPPSFGGGGGGGSGGGGGGGGIGLPQISVPTPIGNVGIKF